MLLLRLCTDQIQVGHPLPWNVYDEHSQLLLHRGYLLQDQPQLAQLVARGAFADQADVDRHEREQRQAARRADPVALWADLQQRMAQLLRGAPAEDPDDAPGVPHGAPDLASTLQDIAQDLLHTVDHHREIALFEALQGDDPQHYAVSHVLQTAFVTNLVGSRLGWSEAERTTLTQAALSMNLGMTALQAELALQRTPLNRAQRQAVDEHGHLSRALLEQAGVTDLLWLHAVEHHHLTPNGGPLPEHHAQAGDLACMLHYADVYLAKISARATRPALPSHVAARTFFIQTNGQHNPYVAALIKEVGVYPPGSCVRLANGDIGVVVRRGEVAHQPRVRSLLDAQGRPLPQALNRDTSLAPFKVTDALPRGTFKTRLSANDPSVQPGTD
jgi:HD-GYP domain-containing protein (c-di-GMP phosphodiesterase class II)